MFRYILQSINIRYFYRHKSNTAYLLVATYYLI